MTFASPYVPTDLGSRFRRSGVHNAAARRPSGVTIVIPNWNHRAFLPRSIRSARSAVAALGEIGVPGEVLVIDDASRDGSVRQLRSLSSFYGWDDVSTVFLDENSGLCAVRNLGLGLARYRYALVLDADNEVDPAGVSTLYRAAHGTGAVLCYGNLLDVRAGEVVGVRSNEVPTYQLTVDNYIDALALVDADEAVAVGGYTSDHKLQYWADWEFLLHLIAEESLIVFVPTIVGRYHVLPVSMLADSAVRQKDDRNVLRRTYWQTGTLDWNRASLGRVFHPDVGYLDEGWET
jgi:glycosyltransferase involved in cell wall biosynthesis